MDRRVSDFDVNADWFPYGLVGYILYNVGLWFMLRKTGIPPWGAIIPIYNFYLTVKLAGWRGWSLVLFVLPLVNIVAFIVLCRDLGRGYGTGTGMKILLVLFFPFALLGLGLGHWRFVGRLSGSLAP